MKYIKLIILSGMILFSIVVNYKMLISSHYSGFLLNDFNLNDYKMPFEVVEPLNDNFPSLTGTTIPIKSLKARYYIQKDSTDKAIELYHKAIKENPYIKHPEGQLANIYYDKEMHDSSYYYAENAFKAIPDNNIHRDIYFKNLVRLKDTVKLRESFKILKDRNSPDHWIDYLVSRFNIVGANDSENINLLDEFIDYFPSYSDDKRYISLKSLLTIGESNITASVFMNQAGNNFYNEQNYTAAIDHYQFAINYDPTDYVFYENLAMAYNMQGNYLEADKFFNKVINEFKPGNGRSEYLKGLMYVKLDSIAKGCEYLKKAADLNFSGNASETVYIRFCN